MARKSALPITIREQSSVVKIYREKSATTKSGYIYRLTWVGPDSVMDMSRANLDEAKDEAGRKARLFAAGIANSQHFDRSDITELTEARAITGEFPLLSALGEWKKAREPAGPAVIEACEA